MSFQRKLEFKFPSKYVIPVPLNVIPAKAGTQKKQKMTYFVYILASSRNGTLYIGVTSNLEKRMHQHRNGTFDGFSKMYGCARLVHYETTSDVAEALLREKRLKKWNRAWKLRLIEEQNPNWTDLFVFDDLSDHTDLSGSPPSRG